MVISPLLIALWQTLLLFGFRRMVGRVEPGNETSTVDQAHQFTLRQGLYFVGSVAVLLAMAQFLKWDGLNLPDILGRVIFLIGFGAVLTVPATLSIWISLRVENPISSCLLSVSSVIPVALIYHVAEGLPPKTLQDVAFFYGPSLIVAFIVWFAIRYRRAHGYRVVKA